MAVRFLRSLRGWNQRELGEASGVDKNLISQYERGKKVPSRRTLEKLVAAVGIPFALFEDTLPFIHVVRSALAKGVIDEHDLASFEEIGPVSRSVSGTVYAAMAEALTGLSFLTRPEREPVAGSARILAGEQWRRLSRYPMQDQQVLVEGAREFQTWAMCERLCEESERTAIRDPGRALELAEMALSVALLVPGGEGPRSRLQAYAWAYVGNAWRAAGDFTAAGEAIIRARMLWLAGSPGDEGALEEWRLLEITGPLDEE